MNNSIKILRLPSQLRNYGVFSGLYNTTILMGIQQTLICKKKLYFETIMMGMPSSDVKNSPKN